MKFMQEFDPQRSRFCSVEPLTMGLMMGGSAALQAGGSIFSGIMGKSAAKKQSEAIRRAQAAASGEAKEYGLKADRQLEPWRTRGNEAGATLADILQGKINLDDMVGQSSLFKFQQETGTRDINRQLKARGLYGSGAGLETLARFESQLLGEEGERTMGRLFQLSESGRAAATNMATNNMSTGNLLADIAMKGGLGQAQAGYQGDMAIAGMGKSLFDIGASGLNSYMQYDMMKPVLDRMAGKTAQPTAAEISDGREQELLGRGIVAGSRMPPVTALQPTLLAPPINEYSMGPMAPNNWSFSH